MIDVEVDVQPTLCLSLERCLFSRVTIKRTIHALTPREYSTAYRFVLGHVSSVFWGNAIDYGHARQVNGFGAYPNKVDMFFIDQI